MPLLESLLKEDQFKSVVAYQVDFEFYFEFLSNHNAHFQSTLIVFKGKKERGRSIGDTHYDSIRRLLLKGL